MKIIEINSIHLHGIGVKLYFFDNTFKDADRIVKKKEPG